MALFKKKKHEETEIETNSTESNSNDDSITYDNNITYQKLPDMGRVPGLRGDSFSSDSVKADIERLYANMEALKETRKITNERLARISEEIGELRSMLVDRERQIQEIDAKSSKAAELVSEIQPEKLMIEMKKEEAKIESIKAQFEAHDKLLSEIINSVKDIKAQMNMFAGVEHILELNEEVKKQLEYTKKLESDIKRHAEKVEEIFIITKKRFPEIEELKTISLKMKEEHDKMLHDFEEIKFKIMQFSEKQEIDDLRNLINRNTQQWQKKFDEINILSNQMGSIVEQNKRTMEQIDSNVKLIDQRLFNVVTRDELARRQNELRDEIKNMVKDEIRKALIDREIQKGKELFSKIDEIKRLVSLANILINDNKIEEAKKSYLKANALYSQLDKEKQIEVYDLLEDLYNRINR